MYEYNSMRIGNALALQSNETRKVSFSLINVNNQNWIVPTEDV